MKLFQKIIFISGLIIASVYFIYTLSFSTGWALGESFGDFYEEAQVVNKLIYKFALWTLIFAALNILFHSHTNRRFYRLNFGSVVLFSVSSLVSGIITIIKVTPLKESYLNVDPVALELITTFNYTKISTAIFDYGVVISILLIIQALLVIFMTIYKFRHKLIVLR